MPEKISFSELAREQLVRIEPMIREKDIQVQYQEDGVQVMVEREGNKK
ncbi:MAG: hypothetical protein HFG54_05235 [Lachnospiraceae bacterium]|nr:hypothetical protein [Lachnospiraceae bacterium]